MAIVDQLDYLCVYVCMCVAGSHAMVVPVV